MEKSADESVRRINAALGNISKGAMQDLAAPLSGITTALAIRDLAHYDSMETFTRHHSCLLCYRAFARCS
jgi:hypothetical protein